jgi:hypothetical protein
MSGLWMIFLFGFLTDELLPAPLLTNPKSETLPKPVLVASNMASNAGNNAAPQLDPASAPTIANAIAAEDCKVGWGTDPTDRSMYMVIQIAPRAIAQFAAGTQSMELESIIPPALRGRVQKVIIRVGSGPVEQSPPESELARLPLSQSNTSSAPTIANLDRRSAVNIDPPLSATDPTRSSEPSIVSTSGTTQLPVVPGLSLPSTGSAPQSTSFPSTPYTGTPVTGVPVTGTPVTGSAIPTYPNEVLPNTPSSTPTVISTPIPSSPSTYSATPSYGGTTAAPAWNNNTQAATQPTDGFAPMPRTVPNTLNPFGTNRASTTAGATNNPNNRVVPATSTAGTSTQGNVTYGGTNGTSTSGTSGLGAGYNLVPHLANNPAGYNYQNNGAFNNPPPGGYVLPNDPNYTQYNNQYGHNYNHGATLPNAPVLPIPQVASRPFPSTSSSIQTQTDSSGRPLESTYQSRGTLLPFFLVLSFILNIYFGLWLNHLSTKYRHLLGNVRGLATSDQM